MDKNIAQKISEGLLEQRELLDDREIEVATKILKDLEGTLVIRATSILEFCLKAIQYSKL